MERNDESIYFIYPADNFNLKKIKTVLQQGYPISSGEPTLQPNEKVQSFSEEDVNNFGIENLCKKSMNGSDNACVVLRIPKSYLGLAEGTNIDMSPIFSQLKKSENRPEDWFAPMHNLIYGVYSPLTLGFITSPNYDSVCKTYGILTNEQRKMAEMFAHGSDTAKAMKYYDMLEHDSKVRNNYPSTTDIEADATLKNELEGYYLNNPNLVVAQNVWESNLRHKITDAEFDQAIAMNKNRGM